MTILEAHERKLPEHLIDAAAAAAHVAPEVLEEAVRLALIGGPDVEVRGWQEDADCRGLGPGRFYPDRGVGREFQEVIRRCKTCCVQTACLAAAIGQGEKQGIWGGTSGEGRRRLRKVLREAGVMGVVGEDAYVSWIEEGADREPPPVEHRDAGITPRPHQVDAVRAVVAAIAEGGSCQISMATASGKTHVGLWAAEALQAQRVLVLVPNLSLVSQTAELWLHAAAVTPRMLAVCSDTGELDLEATTDPDVVREFLTGDGPAVVLATYQSSAVLATAGCRFDLTIADEAHHLAGVVDKAFAVVLRGEIPTDRTLYMTATPKRFRRGKGDVELVSMEEGSAFGPRVYELSLSDAVNAGVVADYRVVVAAVDRATFDRVAAVPELADVDPHLLAGAIAVVRAMGELGLSSCVSFHTRIERARTFSALVGAVADALPDARPPSPGWAGYVHGGTSVRIRRRLLGRLTDTATWGVLANAKSLGEGVDVPTLDAVAIVDPKTSESEVMQATGRALRRPGTAAKVGTVLLPVLLSDNVDGDDLLAGVDPRSLEIVSGVLRALRAHDSELGSRLDVTRRELGRPRQRDVHAGLLAIRAMQRKAARGLLRSRVELWVPGGATGELAGALSLHLLRESTSSWETAYGRLLAWVEEHGSIPGQVAKVPDETGTFALGAWVSVQRQWRSKGLLATERVAALEAVPKWSWTPRDEQWWHKFDVLKDYIETHGGRIPSNGLSQYRGVKLGQFVNVIRTAYTREEGNNRKGWIHEFPDRIAAIEALPGWTWNARDAQWEDSFSKLERYVAMFGHADPMAGDMVDGRDVGKWVQKQKSRMSGGDGWIDHRRGRRYSSPLSQSRIDRLRALPGWRDSTRRDVWTCTWEENRELLVGWMAAHAGETPPQSLVLDSGFYIGRWVAKQRSARRTGRLPVERIASLEAIDGWSWEPRAGQWEACYELLVELAEHHRGDGPLRVPTDARARGVNLSNWATTQRMAYRAGDLEDERARRLDTARGWAWRVNAVDELQEAV